MPGIALLALLLAAFPAAGAAGAANASPDPARLEALRGASRAAVRDYAAELKQALTTALAAGGPVAAVAVCREQAPRIERRVAARYGLEIGRTALRVRNPANAPDGVERTALEFFRERLAGGAEPAALELAALDGGRFRYLRAIPTGGLCVTCHGPDLDLALAAAIDRLYPADRARGFTPGELRGAFTVSAPLAP